MVTAERRIPISLHLRNPRIAALAHELDAAISVWADLPLQSARTTRASRHIAALEVQLATLQFADRSPAVAA